VEWQNVFDIVGSTMLKLDVTLSSSGLATEADSFELQYKLDGGISWQTLARFVGDGQVFRQDANLDGMSEVNGAIIAINNLTATRHSFATIVEGNSLALRVMMLFSSATAAIAMDDVKAIASFDLIPITTTTALPGPGPAQAARSSSNDANTGVSHWLIVNLGY
jgi:hypothetical protein